MSKKAIPPTVPESKFQRVEMPHISDIEGLEDIGGIGDKVAVLMAERRRLDEEIKVLTTVARAIMEEHKTDSSWSVRDDEERWVACYVKPADRKKIIPEKLIEQGVTFQQIEKATQTFPTSPFVKFMLPNEKNHARTEEE